VAALLAAKPVQQRRVALAEGEIFIAADTNVMAQKKAGAEYLLDISATRLSL
jgi:hypothetical protein